MIVPNSGGLRVRQADAPEVLELFQRELAMVEIIAKQVCRAMGSLAEYDEVVSAGREGLLDAARRFEPDRGVRFGSYAHHRVKGAMVDSVRRNCRLPRRARERVLALQAATEFAAGSSAVESANSPGVAEIHDELTERLNGMAAAAALSLTADPAYMSERLQQDPETAAEHAELLDKIATKLQGMSAEEALVVRRFYYDGDSLEQISGDLGVTRSWASRLHTRAIARLRRYLDDLDR
ncbi:MAG: sigma-70 family RNA polymerase sigma factor [Myxococcota bacterium]